jgi:uncharacterized protein (TIGR02594 family)
MLPTPDQPAWLTHAWTDLGVREDTSATSNPHVVAYYAAVGHPEIRDDAVAWCAAFLGACLERAGHRSTRSLLARSYLAWGEPINEPRLGAIAVLSRGSDPALGHVGFVAGATDEHMILLSGNQSDQVTVSAFPLERVLGLRWPTATQPSPSVSAPLFDRALAHILMMEGGYTDDPLDPGGPTNLGLTLVDLAANQHQPLNDATRPALLAKLKSLTPPEAAPVYLTRYWQPARCPDLPPALALMHVDAAVNHGLGAAARMLQQALGVTVDGEIGPETLSAAHAQQTAETLSAYAALRRTRYRALPHFYRFGRGWLARVDQTLAAAQHEIALPPTQKEPAMSDTTITTSTEPKWWGHSLTIWGTIITAASTVLPVLGPLIGLDVTPEIVKSLGDGVAQTVQALGGLIGTIMAITGRARATAPLTRKSISLTL